MFAARVGGLDRIGPGGAGLAWGPVPFLTFFYEVDFISPTCIGPNTYIYDFERTTWDPVPGRASNHPVPQNHTQSNRLRPP